MNRVKKTALTPIEKIQVAHGYYVAKIDQHALAALFAVNGGRVAEACKEVALAVGLKRDGDQDDFLKQGEDDQP